MIKLATMTSVCPDWTLTETIAQMKKLGYTGLEPRVEWGHASGIEADLSADQRKDVAAQITDAGLEICCIATGVRMATADAAARAKHVEDLKRYIDLAGDLGCPLLRTFGGPRDQSKDFPPVVAWTADGYRQVLGQAEARGVTVLMETHDDWCSSAPVRAVVEAVASPRLRVLWDLMHPQRQMERPQETFANIGALTLHLHAHDRGYDAQGNGIATPLGKGMIDHATPLKLMGQAGFDGYISIEVIHKPKSQHDARGVLKEYATGLTGYLKEAGLA